MQVLRSMRLMLLALLIAVIPASSYAGVFISVGFAPPVLPVYVQPPCPEPGWMWTPGYWAYGDDGYYWVPGTWVPAPYEGALWTPGYWGWGGGFYAWHPGYWGRHVGYYGGVNYGFGYMGVGFAGGLWVGGAFRYNTAVMRVGPGIRNTYIDNTIVHNTTIVNERRVAYSGGQGGINHPPTAQENAYSHESHQGASSYQSQHETAARANVNSYASRNGGHPATAAVARPMSANARGSINYNASKSNTGNVKSSRGPSGNANERGAVNYNASRSNTGNAPAAKTYNASHSNVGNAPAPRTYNASHSNTNAQPAHTGGGQHGGQPHGQPHSEGHEKGR